MVVDKVQEVGEFDDDGEGDWCCGCGTVSVMAAECDAAGWAADAIVAVDAASVVAA